MSATEVHGDVALATTVRDRLGHRHPVFAVATVSPRGPAVASVGTPLDADFELGSISKAITGMLYVDALARGEIHSTSTLGEFLPLGDVEVATVTLASISTHRSGLPRLPKAAAPVRRTIALWRHGTNPYGETLDEIVAQARGVRVARPRARYSNLGFELLGHAIARAAGSTYADLVDQRIAQPLGLSALYVPATADELRPSSLLGRSRSGRPRQPWTGEALGPAGGVRASINDMVRLASALLDGSAPGSAALDPVASFSGRAVRIGAAWLTLDVRGRAVTWHNGGTGGFRTWIGLERSASTGVVLMSATSSSVDRRGFDVLASLTQGDGR